MVALIDTDVLIDALVRSFLPYSLRLYDVAKVIAQQVVA